MQTGLGSKVGRFRGFGRRALVPPTKTRGSHGGRIGKTKRKLGEIQAYKLQGFGVKGFRVGNR